MFRTLFTVFFLLFKSWLLECLISGKSNSSKVLYSNPSVRWKLYIIDDQIVQKLLPCWNCLSFGSADLSNNESDIHAQVNMWRVLDWWLVTLQPVQLTLALQIILFSVTGGIRIVSFLLKSFTFYTISHIVSFHVNDYPLKRAANWKQSNSVKVEDRALETQVQHVEHFVSCLPSVSDCFQCAVDWSRTTDANRPDSQSTASTQSHDQNGGAHGGGGCVGNRSADSAALSLVYFVIIPFFSFLFLSLGSPSNARVPLVLWFSVVLWKSVWRSGRA